MSSKGLPKMYKEQLAYVFWGAITTGIDWVLFFLLCNAIGEYWAAAVAWAGAVVFAYVTNKLFVFDSKSWKLAVVGPEFLKFAGARAFSLGLTEVLLWLFVELLFVPAGIVKIGSSVLTVILNYVFSKLFVFRRKENG